MTDAHPPRTVGLIPARYASTRFPGKPIHPIAGRPLLQHVVDRCRLASRLHDVIVATDDPRIAEVASRFARVEMTRADHPSGTDRIAEVAARLDCDRVVNIQGDEPLIEPSVINAVADALDHAPMSTAVTPLRDPADFASPNVVKAVVGQQGNALYFSRHPIPYVRDLPERTPGAALAAFPYLKHLGIYGYRRATLMQIVEWPPSPLECAEKLEQLRALEHGITLRVVQVAHESLGVDVPADVEKVEAILRSRQAS